MKLRNKKTGEIGNLVLNINPNRESYSVLSTENGDTICGNLVVADYNSLAELNEVWEDYEEPEEYWYYDTTINGVDKITHLEDKEKDQAIGNYFETEEEAEKAVEKLKAWKRLKEANIDYKLSREYDDFTETMHANVSFSFNSYPLVGKDLGLLFGGENE